VLETTNAPSESRSRGRAARNTHVKSSPLSSGATRRIRAGPCRPYTAPVTSAVSTLRSARCSRLAAVNTSVQYTPAPRIPQWYAHRHLRSRLLPRRALLCTPSSVAGSLAAGGTESAGSRDQPGRRSSSHGHHSDRSGLVLDAAVRLDSRRVRASHHPRPSFRPIPPPRYHDSRRRHREQKQKLDQIERELREARALVRRLLALAARGRPGPRSGGCGPGSGARRPRGSGARAVWRGGEADADARVDSVDRAEFRDRAR
jgi:hypothetical protein